jgi:hypothetical protein
MGKNFNILNELEDVHAVFLIKADKKNLFFVPLNYFEELPDAIRANIFLHAVTITDPFTVPENYFDNFPALILNKIKDNTTTLISAIGNNNRLYSIPENYFESFASEVLKKIKHPQQISVQQELEDISPFLSTIPRRNVYSVPENYFNNINKNIPSKSPAKIISISSKTRKWANYAAAACIAALLFGASFLHFYKKGNAEIPSVVSSVSNEDLQKQISVLSDEEITNYLKTNSNLAVYTNTATDDYQQQNMDVQNMLQNMSDQEIQQYLDQHPESSSTEEGI